MSTVNASFTKVEDTRVQASKLLKGHEQLDGVGSIRMVSVDAGATPVSITGGVAAGSLTAAQLQLASTVGLQLDNAGGTYFLIANVNTAANAKAIQDALGLTLQGQSKLLTFFWYDSPGADVLIGLASAPDWITITVLGTDVAAVAANAKLFEFTPLATGVTRNKSEVLVTATDVTSLGEKVLFTILQSGGTVL